MTWYGDPEKGCGLMIAAGIALAIALVVLWLVLK